jgi:hypothetical protein
MPEASAWRRAMVVSPALPGDAVHEHTGTAGCTDSAWQVLAPYGAAYKVFAEECPKASPDRLHPTTAHIGPDAYSVCNRTLVATAAT